MSIISNMKAINKALDEELAHDHNVFLMGEDIAKMGGCFGVTQGLLEKYGAERVINTPISENGYCSLGVGAAIYGKRPVVELMFGDFSCLAFDAIANEAAQQCYLSLGRQPVPIVFRTAHGTGGGAGAHHSQTIESWFMSVPGLTIVSPTKPDEYYGLLKASIRSNRPVLFLEQKITYGIKGEVPDEEYITEIGKARVVKEGTDVTLIANQRTRIFAEEALPELEKAGISVELIDPLTIKPFDKETMITSAKKTGRVIIATEARKTGGYAAEFAASIYEECMADLKKPISRVCAMDVPIPKGRDESLVIPSKDEVAEAVLELMK